MELKLTREFKGAKHTIGKLFVNGVFYCDTLEDVDRGLEQNQPLAEIQAKKVYGETAIPKGKYVIDMSTVSPKFKDRIWATPYNGIVPRLLGVPGFEGVLIHPGNKAEDTLGCILVGKNSGNTQITNSVETYKPLFEKMIARSKAGELIHIEIQ